MTPKRTTNRADNEDPRPLSLDQALQLVRELHDELKVTDELLATRNEVLKAIPPCPAHGDECAPHALEWIAEIQQSRDDLLEACKSISDEAMPPGRTMAGSASAGLLKVWAAIARAEGKKP